VTARKEQVGLPKAGFSMGLVSTRVLPHVAF
jgi:hypothetical protein